MKEPTRVVCLGGGWAAFYLARALRSDVRAGRVDLRVVSRDNYHTFHGFIAEMLTARIQSINIANPVRQIIAPARFHNAEIEGVDLETRQVFTRRLLDGREYTLPYDHLVLALGSVDDLARYPGIAEHTHRVKTYWEVFKTRAHILAMMEAAEFESDPEERARLLTFLVVGGNFGGVEIAGEMMEYLRGLTRREYPGIRADEIRIVLVEGSARLLPEIAERLPAMVTYTERELQRVGLEVRTGVRVQAATREEALLNDGTRIPTRTIISCSGTMANPVVAALPLETDARGRAITDDTLRTRNFPNVWAGGDCAAVPHPAGGTCPPVAIFAMMGGRRIGLNISRIVKGREPKRFRFSGLGEAASMGHHKAIYHLKGLRLYGLPAWVLWRVTFLFFVPSWRRKLRLLVDWATTAVLGRDVVNVQVHEPFGLRRELYEPGQAIVREGERGDRLYLIWSGEVDVVRAGEDGAEQHVATLGAGEHFGEIAVFQNTRRTATVRARTRVEVLALGKSETLALSQTLQSFDAAVRRLPGIEPAPPVPSEPR